MLKRLKNSTIDKQIDMHLKKREVSERNSPLKHLGFIIDEDFIHDFEGLLEFGKDLGLHHKDIKLFTFKHTDKKLLDLRDNQITNKEFNWRGEVYEQSFIDFLDYPFDVLIGLYEGNQKLLDLMIAKSKAKFKIGFKAADLRLFDLILNIDMKDQELFKREVSKYLKVFKKI